MSNPNTNEQYLLELTNRMRMQPEAELKKLLETPNREVKTALSYFNVDLDVLSQQWKDLKPAAPLAWSSALHQSATTHSELMIQHDTQSHNLPGEPKLLDRLQDAGYDAVKAAENVFAYPESIFATHAGFAIDWGESPTGIQEPAGHRITLVNNDYREVGMAAIEENDPNTRVGSLVVTQHFGLGRGTRDRSWLVGAIYNDRIINDNFYTPGEGLGEIRIEAERETNGDTYETESWSSGGYQLQLPNGSYRVTFTGDLDGDGRMDVETRYVEIAGDNVKLDWTHGTPADETSQERSSPANTLNRMSLPALAQNYSSEVTEAAVEAVELADFPTEVNGDRLTGSIDADTLLGSDRDDALRGGSGDDVLVGQASRDRLDGENGNDILFGNADADTLSGGSGDDELYGGRDDDLIVSGEGNDAVMGDFGDDTVIGNAGADELYGNFGNDIIEGGDDDDRLYGGADNDTLIGGMGDDTLCGDGGDDLLTGGSGRDRFDLKPGSGQMTVTDFEVGVDAIGLGDGLQTSDFTSVSVGGNLQLIAQDTSIILEGVDATAFSSQMFVAV